MSRLLPGTPQEIYSTSTHHFPYSSYGPDITLVTNASTRFIFTPFCYSAYYDQQTANIKNNAAVKMAIFFHAVFLPFIFFEMVFSSYQQIIISYSVFSRSMVVPDFYLPIIPASGRGHHAGAAGEYSHYCSPGTPRQRRDGPASDLLLCRQRYRPGREYGHTCLSARIARLRAFRPPGPSAEWLTSVQRAVSFPVHQY